MEKLNLVEILKNCPKGTQLYSTIHGNVELVEVLENNAYPIKTKLQINSTRDELVTFTANGCYYKDYPNGECVLFPSKENRDWTTFKSPKATYVIGDHFIWKEDMPLLTYIGESGGTLLILKELSGQGRELHIPKNDVTFIEKFDPKLFKPGDAVLVRNFREEEWEYAIFSHITTMAGGVRYFKASCTLKNKCIPYNVETKHLIGTEDDAPEFYRE